MPTGVKQQTDVVLDTIASFLRSVIEYEVGEDALNKILKEPRALNEPSNADEPFLIIRRTRQRTVYLSEYPTRRITITFEYVLPAGDFCEREAYYPALQAVWTAISDSLARGRHESITEADGETMVEVLDLAAIDVDDETADVQFDIVSRGRDDGMEGEKFERHPFFRGTIEVDHSPERVDWSALPDFLRMHTGYWLPDTPAEDMTEADPEEVRRAVTTHTFPAASEES